MLSNVKHGWCDFDLFGFHGTPSYLCDPVMQIGQLLLDEVGVTVLDEEGTDFILVADGMYLFIIENKKQPKLYADKYYNISLVDIANEFVDDVHRDYDDWVNWYMEEDTVVRRMQQIERLLDDICKKYNL